MKYIFIFLLMLSLSSGLITSFFSALFLSKNKDNVSKFFIVYQFSLLLIIIISVVLFVLQLFNKNHSSIFFTLIYLSKADSILLSIIGIIITFNLLKLRKSVISGIVITISIISIFLFILYVLFQIKENYNNQIYILYGNIDFIDFFVNFSPLVCGIIILLFQKRIDNKFSISFVKSLAFLGILMTPFLFIENLNINLIVDFNNLKIIKFKFIIFPVCYFIVNIVILYSGYKYFISPKKNAENKIEPVIISKNFIIKYNITNREQEVIVLLIKGYSNKVIAEKLGISSATVRNHLHNIFDKTEAANRTELSKISRE